MGYGYYEPDIYAGNDALFEVASGFGAFLLVFLGVFLLIALAIGVLSYIFQSVGMYTIAKRRGIHNPWLAWIPVGNMWLLGSISDQYQYVAKNKEHNRRKVLLGLMLAVYGLMGVYYVLQAASMVGVAMGEGAVVGAVAAISILVYIAMMVICIVLAVFQYIAMYDMYCSCAPDNAVVYLVLSIFVSIAIPILFFICRNKDDGMPKRVVRPAQPVQPAVLAEPQVIEPAQETPVEE